MLLKLQIPLYLHTRHVVLSESGVMAGLPVSKLYPWSVYEQVVDKHSPFSMYDT